MSNKVILLVIFLSILIINYIAWYQTWTLVIKNKNWYKLINFYLILILYAVTMNMLIKSKDKLIINSTVNIILSIALFLFYIGAIYYSKKIKTSSNE